jgi:hypothetical protein
MVGDVGCEHAARVSRQAKGTKGRTNIGFSGTDQQRF